MINKGSNRRLGGQSIKDILKVIFFTRRIEVGGFVLQSRVAGIVHGCNALPRALISKVYSVNKAGGFLP